MPVLNTSISSGFFTQIGQNWPPVLATLSAMQLNALTDAVLVILEKSLFFFSD